MNPRKKWIAVGAASALGLGITGFGSVAMANAVSSDSLPADVPGIQVGGERTAQIGSAATSTTIDQNRTAVQADSVVTPDSPDSPVTPTAPSPVTPPSPISPDSPASVPSAD